MQTHQSVGRTRFAWCAALALLLAVTPARSGEPDPRPLTFGVLPFMSPIALLKRFAPLRDHLAARLGRPVLLETARDYPEFVRRTAERRYDIVLTAPHFTLLAVDSGRYEVRATYVTELAAVILVRADGPIRSVDDLAGKIVATPPPEAVITLAGRRLLDTYLAPGARPLYRNYLSHNAAYKAVAGGEASAAIVTVNVVEKATAPEAGLVELTRSPGFPAMGILVAADLTAEIRQRATDAFVELDDHEAGRALLRRIRYPGYRPAGAEEFEAVRTYLTDSALAGVDP